MEPYWEFNALTYDSIGDFIERAAHLNKADSLYFLGKAAAYVDVAYTLDLLSKLEARELHVCIAVYAGCNTI